ncbi:MAG TPA: serine/threonine-protein kinase [Kofleriaceae bacterium]|nr:serine/threonine-protein kinase [Kofleriaceae bacterium]
MAEHGQGVILRDRYELREELGAGTSGAVHRAFDRTLGREVAIKLMHDVPQGDALRRFEREAKIAARLRHPDMIEVFDIGEHEGRPFLVMELVTAPTLARAVLDANAAPSIAAATELGAAIADVLAAAHAAGVVHRDLKPSNVFVEGPLDAPQRCRLTDFGLAFMIEPPTETLGRLTAEGVMLGTPYYMAPEQASGGEVGPSADVYSLGCMIHELIGGRPPFIGNLARIVAGHLYLPPPLLRELEPDAPIELEQLVLAMLDKSPAARPTASEVAERLRGLRAAGIAGGSGAPGALADSTVSAASRGGRRQRSATAQGRLARAIAPSSVAGESAGSAEVPAEVPAVALEVDDPALAAGLQAEGIELADGAPLAIVAFEALARPAGARRARVALHPAPTASSISAAIRLGADGVARWPGPIASLATQIRKTWRRLPRP